VNGPTMRGEHQAGRLTDAEYIACLESEVLRLTESFAEASAIALANGTRAAAAVLESAEWQERFDALLAQVGQLLDVVQTHLAKDVHPAGRTGDRQPLRAVEGSTDGT
jgi:hypothetical protein